MSKKHTINSLYDDDPKTKKYIKPEEDSDLELYREIEFGFSVDDSLIYFHGDVMLGNLFDIVSKCRVILQNREENDTSPITILINSNGGDVYEALGIIDYIQTLSVPVNVIARGRAMSAAALILCCATGIRAASKNTTIMVHEASAEIFGKSGDIKANADHIDILEEEFYKLLASKSNHDEEFWRKSCRKDFYMTAEKALELGLIDKII